MMREGVGFVFIRCMPVPPFVFQGEAYMIWVFQCFVLFHVYLFGRFWAWSMVLQHGSLGREYCVIYHVLVCMHVCDVVV